MIRLTRASKPAYLDPATVAKLTAEYKSTGKSVWNNEKIKDPLLGSSENKCAYCECYLIHESNYMEVEHFEDKYNNPDKVVEWDNLLPSCKKCNGAKGTHDVTSNPIVNPYVDDPREHLVLRLFRIRGKSKTGIETVQVLQLNHSTRLVTCRFNIGEKIEELIETAKDRLYSFQENRTALRRNKLLGIVEGMLEECQPTSAYSAVTATNLLTDDEFVSIVNTLKEENIWSEELEKQYDMAKSIMLEKA